MALQLCGPKKTNEKHISDVPKSEETPARQGFVPMIGPLLPPEMNKPLNDSAREMLCVLVQKNGLMTECPEKIEAMLEKSCPGCRREINALVTAFRNGISGDLMWNPSEEPKHVLFKRLVKRLQDNEGLLPRVAHWAVESWVLALSFVKWTKEQEVMFGGGYSSMDLFPSQINIATAPRRWLF